MPARDLSIEPHPGGGAIMGRRPPARRGIGIDLNRRAVDGFRRGHPVGLRHGRAHRFLSGPGFQGRGPVQWASRAVALPSRSMTGGGARCRRAP